MTYYMRQKVFSWKDRFSICNEQEEECYSAEGELFTFGKKLHLYRADGTQAAFIQQKLFSFLPRYFVFCDEVQKAEIVKQFSFFHPRYEIQGPGWRIEGSFWEHDYEIYEECCPIATIRKAWLSWGDCYSIEIASGADEALVLAAVLAIDCVLADESAAAAGS